MLMASTPGTAFSPSVASSLARPAHHKSPSPAQFANAVVKNADLLERSRTSSVSMQAPSWELHTSQSVLRGLRKRTTNKRPLDLLTDLHDEESELCSEGIWHNAWLGIAHVQTARQLRRDGAREESTHFFESAVILADSMYDLSFDDGFRRRVRSGIWKSADDMALAIEAAGEKVAYYTPSRERRCVQNAAAVVFFSLLEEEAVAQGSGDASRLAVNFDEISKSFLDEFYDSQMGRFRRSANTDEPNGHYWRAVDQAIGILACLRIERLDPRWYNTDTYTAREAARRAVRSLLYDFGYAAYIAGTGRPVNHLGQYPGERRRNSWHDALACFALAVFAEAPGGDDLVTSGDIAKLLRAIHADYSDANDLLVHQPNMRGLESPKNVQFTCTQAIWGAVGRAAMEILPVTYEAEKTSVERHRAAFNAFHASYVDDSNLFPVANVYLDRRLWCNTEPAAWLLAERSDFLPYPPRPI